MTYILFNIFSWIFKLNNYMYYLLFFLPNQNICFPFLPVYPFIKYTSNVLCNQGYPLSSLISVVSPAFMQKL